jgi:aspartate carbamoyltransferase
MSLVGRDIITTKGLEKEELLYILRSAEQMEARVKKERVSDLLSQSVVAIVFLEPSTRTMMSFVAAAKRLSARTITISDAKSSSAAKGESLADTARTIEGYVDCIVIRQPVIGGAEVVADSVDIPVINAGDGPNQHPTQALLDLYTIHKEKEKIEELTIAMVGDLKYGRTVHSLSYALAHFNSRYIYCSPEELKMPGEILEDMRAGGVDFQVSNNIEDAMQADVVYMTRIQRERFEDTAEYDRLKGSYILTRELVQKGNKDMLIMHPLPRVDEISPEVDELPNAAYFRQVRNGVYTRMALLALVLGKA